MFGDNAHTGSADTLGVVGVMGMPYMTLMPVFAAHVHRSGADGPSE